MVTRGSLRKLNSDVRHSATVIHCDLPPDGTLAPPCWLPRRHEITGHSPSVTSVARTGCPRGALRHCAYGFRACLESKHQSAMLHFATLLEPRNCTPPGNFLKCPRVNSNQPQDLGTLKMQPFWQHFRDAGPQSAVRAWDSWCLRDVWSIPELSIEHLFPLWLGSGCDYADGQRDGAV